MGSCLSQAAAGESAAVAPPPPPAKKTAKLILADGGLREFASPVKLSQAVPKEPDWFVCDADDMDFDGFATEISAEDELRLGQIYFVLPRSILGKPMRGESLAALAVRASDALMSATGKGTVGFVEWPELGWGRSRRILGERKLFEMNLEVIME